MELASFQLVSILYFLSMCINGAACELKAERLSSDLYFQFTLIFKKSARLGGNYNRMTETNQQATKSERTKNLPGSKS